MNFLEKLTYWGPLVILGFLCAAISIFLLFVVWGGVTLGFTAARVIVLVLQDMIGRASALPLCRSFLSTRCCCVEKEHTPNLIHQRRPTTTRSTLRSH